MPDDVHPTVVLTEDGLLLVVCSESVFVTLVLVVVDLRDSRRPMFDSFGANVFGWHPCRVHTARGRTKVRVIIVLLLVGGWDGRRIFTGVVFPLQCHRARHAYG